MVGHARFKKLKGPSVAAAVLFSAARESDALGMAPRDQDLPVAWLVGGIELVREPTAYMNVRRMQKSETLMPSNVARSSSPPPPVNMQDRIKKVTTELLIRHGYHGTSFRVIAQRLGTTTTNIHYHFGNKQRLVELVIQEYVRDASARQRRIWLDSSSSLRQKLRNVAEANHQRFRKFNRGGRTNRPWSLIGRMRLDIDVLSSPSVEALSLFTSDLHVFIRDAVDKAVDSGELQIRISSENVVFLLVNLINSSSIFAQDAGSFDRVDKLYDVVADLLLIT